MGATSTPQLSPSFPRMVGRALLRRCPLCGGHGAWFRGWFKRDDRCHTCGFRWSRGEDGFETGAMTVSIIITFGLITAVLVGVTVATYPDLPVAPFILALVAIGLLVPVVVYPLSHTIWSAADIAMHRPGPEELAAAGEVYAAHEGRPVLS